MKDRQWNENWHESATAGAARMFNGIATRSSALCAATMAAFSVAAGATGHMGTAALFVGGLLLQAGMGVYNLRHHRYYANPLHRSPPGRNEHRCREALVRIAAPPVLAMATFGAACFVYEPHTLPGMVAAPPPPPATVAAAAPAQP